MPTRISTLLRVSRDDLENLGVFDATVDFDSKLHIDPALISHCQDVEFKDAGIKIAQYFNDVLKLLSVMSRKGDAMWRAAVERITFGEGLNTGLGYSEKGTGGSGIGRELAERILETVKEILDAGVKDPVIFELVPVFETGVGADRISDMVSIILSDELEAYTSRICTSLGVDRARDHKGRKFFLLPRKILNDLPIAEQWEDVSIAAAYNASARVVLNGLLGVSWKEFIKENKKNDIKQTLLKDPELLKEFLELYKKRVGKNYDFDVDHFGLLLWDILGIEFAEKNPISFGVSSVKEVEEIFNILLKICSQFKKLIEHNGLVNHLYDSRHKRRPERFPQLLFYAIASCYCDANNLDLKREINNGSGALDFGLSRGLAKVNLEIKYSTNAKLVEGYKKQLTAYNKADGVSDNFSIYMILKTGVSKAITTRIKRILDIKKDYESRGESAPEIFIIDADIRPSASKR